MIYAMIRERRQSPGDRGDLLSMLLNAVDTEDHAARMTDQQVHDECLTIMLAGHETTANALSFALWVLAQHPEIQERVHAEAVAVLGTRTATAEDYGRLPYITQVFSETLRLYPPVWVVARMCVEPYEIAGYRIARGSILVASQYVVHRDARFYSDPLLFDPDRFAADRRDWPRFAFFPFAAGSRRCIGEGLAWMEGVLALATIVRDWRVSPPPGAAGEIELQASISLRPKGGVALLVERRG